jgi:hypothetical protein
MRASELTELFRKLGARNPAAWASSQLDENLPQLARFLFLREAWKLVVADGGSSWIKARIGDDPAGPGGEIGPALKRLLATGAAETDLTAVKLREQGLRDLAFEVERFRLSLRLARTRFEREVARPQEVGSSPGRGYGEPAEVGHRMPEPGQ